MKTLAQNLAAGFALAALAAPALAQAPQAPAGGPPPATGVREPNNNLQTKVDPDRYIGDPARTITRVKRDIMLSRVILSPGEPNAQGQDGAVLRYRKEVSLDTLQPGEATALAAQGDQQIVYVKTGEGRLDDGARAWDLKPGLIALIPANQANRISNTGGEQLTLVTLTGAPNLGGPSSTNAILVRDIAKVSYVEQGVHWNNLSKAPFNDLGEPLLIVYLGPMSIAGPHSHPPAWEEGWIKLTDAPALIQIGSEIRPWADNAGLIAPTNDQTVHAAINLSDEVESWIYFQGRTGPITVPKAPPPLTAPPSPTGGRVNSPEIFATSAAATVASHPLPKR
jgi:mannose-6-phosphate isomerase-like protein (cupin superfamily)